MVDVPWESTYPDEVRVDAVARRGQAPLSQIARDSGICEGPLAN